jgi:hypothetical protein
MGFILQLQRVHGNDRQWCTFCGFTDDLVRGKVFKQLMLRKPLTLLLTPLTHTHSNTPHTPFFFSAFFSSGDEGSHSKV